MVYIKQLDLAELSFSHDERDELAIPLLDIQGLISIKVQANNASEQPENLIDHLSAGNLGFFTVITEKRTMRIYWPQLTDDEGNDESNLMAESAAQASMAGVQEDAVMITTN